MTKNEIRKFIDTLRICFMACLARTFGTYKGSEWDGICDYATYEYKGRTYYITTLEDGGI